VLGVGLCRRFKDALGDIWLEMDEKALGRPVGVLEFRLWGLKVGANCSATKSAGIFFEAGVK